MPNRSLIIKAKSLDERKKVPHLETWTKQGYAIEPIETTELSNDWIHGPLANAKPAPGAAYWISRGSPSSKVIFFIHGGGYIEGDPPNLTYERFSKYLIKATGAKIFSINYRLAIVPENAYPYGLYDCLGAWSYLLSTGVKTKDVTCVGDSAGGGLVLATMLYLRDHKLPMPLQMYLDSPFIDLSLSTQSAQRSGPCFMHPKMLKTAATKYAYPRNHVELAASDVYFSPSIAKSYKGLPRTLVIVGEVEILRDEVITLKDAMKRDGLDLTFYQAPDAVHCSTLFPGDISLPPRTAFEKWWNNAQVKL